MVGFMQNDVQTFVFQTQMRLPGGRKREGRANSTFLLNPAAVHNEEQRLTRDQRTEIHYAADITAEYLKMGSNWI